MYRLPSASQRAVLRAAVVIVAILLSTIVNNNSSHHALAAGDDAIEGTRKRERERAASFPPCRLFFATMQSLMYVLRCVCTVCVRVRGPAEKEVELQ